jgi:ATP-dependent RNA helicase RhlE
MFEKMPDEVKSFRNLKLTKQIILALDDLGFNTLTPVQVKVIPQSVAGHDLFGISPTGTGKTAAFIIPLLMKLKYAQGDHPRALILAPTRELALQIDEDINVLSKYYDLRHVCLYGGTGIKNQIERLGSGTDIITATPGRFLDLYYRGHLFPRMIKTMILDEADKMMDMGFRGQINRILEIIPAKNRQNLLFSATLPPAVEELSYEFLEFPVKIEVEPQGTAASTIEQCFYKTPNLKTKINLLEYLLEDSDRFTRVLIFTKKKETANNIFKYIKRKIDDSTRVIHANKSQNTRQNAINAFKNGDIRILVSTDVSARGIDVLEVSHVINFDVPVIYEDYIHRIGRTGRARKSGKSITFVTIPDHYHLQQIEKIIRQGIMERPIPPEVKVEVTEKWEKDLIERDLDRIKRKLNPDYKGAFHKKKPRNHKKRKPG